MKPFRSLRLRITLLCALLLTLCCARPGRYQQSVCHPSDRHHRRRSPLTRP